MRIAAIDNIGIAVRDVDVVSTFFDEKIGLDVARYADAEPPSATVAIGDCYLYLFETQSPDAQAARSQGLINNPPGIDHVSFAVEDLDAAYRNLEQRGVDFEGEPVTDEQWDIRLIGFSDPEGNSYYLVESR